jgi:hypothetical protein
LVRVAKTPISCDDSNEARRAMVSGVYGSERLVR